MKLKNKIMTGVAVVALTLGAGGAAFAQDNEGDSTSAKNKILRTELTFMKSFKDNQGYRGDAFFKLADKQKVKFFLSGSYEDRDINLVNSASQLNSTNSLESSSGINQNLKIAKVGPELYVRTNGDSVFGTLTAGFEYVNVNSTTKGIENGGIDALTTNPMDSSATGHASIITARPGLKIGSGPGWVHLEGIIKKVYSKMGENLGPNELFAGIDNSPLIYGGQANISDLVLLTYLEVKPKTGPKARVFVGTLNNNFAVGDEGAKINNKLIGEYLNKYYNNENEWRFTDIFEYMSPGGHRIGLLLSYKSDRDFRVQVFLPLTKNFQVGGAFQQDEYKGYAKGKNKSIEAGGKISF